MSLKLNESLTYVCVCVYDIWTLITQYSCLLHLMFYKYKRRLINI